jgi:hypothetical protein
MILDVVSENAMMNRMQKGKKTNVFERMLHSRKARIDIQDTTSKRADLTKRNTSI